MSEEKRRPLRRLARILLWALGGLVLVTGLLWAGVNSGWLRERARLMTQARLSETLGREVSVGSLRLGLAPLHAEAEDVVVAGARPGAPPFAEVPALRVEVGLRDLLDPALVVERVDVDRPVVRLIFYPDGTDSIPDVRTGGGEGGGALEVLIGRLLVDEGVVHFDERRIPLSLDAAPVRATLTGPGAVAMPDDQMEASLVAQNLTVGLPDALPWGGTASTRLVLAPGRVELRGGRLHGPDLSARFEGVVRFGPAVEGGGGGGSGGGEGGEAPARAGEIEIEGRGSAALANRLGYLEPELSGPVAFRGEVDLAEPVTYRASWRSEQVVFEGRRFTDLDGSVNGGPDGLEVVVERASHGGGTLSATVNVEAGDEAGGDRDADRPTPVSVQARAREVALAALLQDLDLGDSVLRGLRGLLSADVEYRFTTDGPLDGNGGGIVQLTAVQGGAPGDRLPVSGTVPVSVRRGTLALNDARLTAPGQTLAVSGSYDLAAGNGRFTYRLGSERLGRLARALPLPAGFEGVPPWLPTAGTGTAEGEVEITPDGYTVEAGVELAAVETAVLDLERVSAPVTLAGGILSTGDLVAEGSGQRLLLAGSYDLEEGAGRAEFRLSSDALGRLASLVPVEPPSPWLPTGGSGRVAGELVLESDGAIAGRLDLDLEEVAFDGTTLSRVRGGFRIAEGGLRDLRLEATSRDGALVAAGRLPLPPPMAPDDAPPWTDRPFELTVDLVDWPASALAAFVPGAPPVSGALSGRVMAEGTPLRPDGRADLTATAPTLAGVELEGATLEARFTGSRVTVERLHVASAAGSAVAEGTYRRDDGALDLRLDAAGLDLAAPPFASVVPGALRGTLAVEARVDGTVDAPRVEVTTRGRELAVGGRPPGGDASARLEATWADEELAVEGSLLGLVGFSGGGRLTPEAADLSLQVAGGDLDGLVRLAVEAPPEGLDGTFAGDLRVVGRFDAPSGPEVSLSLDRLSTGFRGHRLENLEPVVVRYEPGRLVIDSLFLGEAADGGEVFLSGSVGMGGDEVPLDLRAQAQVGASWLELVVPDLRLGGRIQALATVGGTLADPTLDGQGEVVDGNLIIPDFPHSLEELQAIVLLYPDRAVLDSSTARVAGGRLRVAGQVDPGEEGWVAGELGYRFQSELTSVALRYPEGFLLRGDANLVLATTPDGRRISGQVDLNRAFYLQDVPVGITELLSRMFEPTRLEAGTADPELTATQLNVAIQGEGALRVRNNVADLSGDIDLVLRGSLASPVLFGQVEVDRGGKIVYSDNDYRVERGLLTFANPYRIDPVIDLVATTDIRSYDITLNLAGTLERLNASFTSDPPLADLEVVSLITTGQPLGQGEPFAGGVGGTPGAEGVGGTAERLLFGQAASILSERVSSLFGFDRFRVSPVSAGTTGSSSLALTVGQQISRDVFVTYSRDPSTPEVDVVQIEWQVYSNVLAVLTRTGDGTYALDVQVERRF